MKKTSTTLPALPSQLQAVGVIGVIGLGQRIAHVLATMKEVGWSLDVAAYVDPGPVGAPILSDAGIALGREYPSPGALLHDGPYDLVMIGTPNHLHMRHLGLAMAAGERPPPGVMAADGVKALGENCGPPPPGE